MVPYSKDKSVLMSDLGVKIECNEKTCKVQDTLGQKPIFNLEITKNLMFEKSEFCEKLDYEIVNFVKNDILKM